MHELRIIREVFDDIQRRAAENQVHRVRRVNLRMGEFTEINEDILRHYFVDNGHGTCLESAELIVELSPTRELRLLSFEGD